MIDSVFRPSASGTSGVALQVPSDWTVAVATVLPCASLMVMTSPAVPCPETVGVVSLVMRSPGVPVSLAASRSASGDVGGVRSIVICSVVVLLAESVMVSVWTPSASCEVSTPHAPVVASATTLASVTPPSAIVTVAPGPVVPSILGVSSRVMRSPAMPESLDAASCADSAFRSIASSLVVLSGLVFPAAS